MGSSALFEELESEVLNAKENDTAAAIGLWTGYPLFAEQILAGPIGLALDAQSRYLSWQNLNSAHLRAAHQLMRLAEREGIDSQCLYRSMEICQRIHHKSKGEPIWTRDRPYDTWPQCITDSNDEVTDEERRIIREADAVLMRLVAKLEIKDSTATPDNDLISATEAAAMTGMSMPALSKLCRDGGPVRFRREKQRLWIHPGDLARCIARREQDRK